ncbi:MAG: tetratricopeptide repeat protein [Kordiimonadaceae bacterium]|nr:tetratricopeptide repeat protein [Kordiimonadaceae bacterium]
MSDEFIREVDEDIRQRQINDLWKKYGKFVIGIAVGVVAIVAGRAIYTSVIESKYSEQASLYSQAISMNDAEISSALDPLLNSDVEAYEILATFKKAEISISNDDRAGAITILDQFVTSSSVAQVYKDMATIQAALLELDTASVDQIRSRLSLILNSDSKYQYFAAEIMALSELRAGDSGAAKSRLEALINDENASGSIKTRAEQYLSVIE